jgi:HPt (histidine-containing phosphotransfer) domain-containing protein
LEQFKRQLHQEFAGLVGELKQIQSNQDYDRVEKRIHSLKGVASNLGLTAIYRATLELDRQLKQYDVIELQQIEHFQAILLATYDDLENWLQQTPSISQAQYLKLDEVDWHKVKQEVKALETSIVMSEFIDRNRLDELFSLLPESVQTYRIALEQTLDQFEFDKAKLELDRLTEVLSTLYAG